MTKSKFSISPDKTVLTTPDNEPWSLDFKLPGRGQDFFAGVYLDPKTQNRYLVKFDKISTCCAEGVVTNQFLPDQYQSCMICADMWMCDDGVVTIQPFQKGAVRLSDIVYPKGRDPKAWVSYESRYQHKIKDFLSSISLNAKMSLAYALYASTALGDESLHLGQFLVIPNQAGLTQNIELPHFERREGSPESSSELPREILHDVQDDDYRVLRMCQENPSIIDGFVKFDFGACGRYGRVRLESSDFDPLNASEAYRKSGQFGKNYISYLLVDPQLKGLFLMLWAQTNWQDISAKQRDEFKNQLEHLPEDLAQKTLLAYWDDYWNLGPGAVQFPEQGSFDKNRQYFLSLYDDANKMRCIKMPLNARSSLQGLINKTSLSEHEKELLKQFINKPDEQYIDEAIFILDKLNTHINSGNLKQSDISHYQQLVAAISMAMGSNRLMPTQSSPVRMVQSLGVFDGKERNSNGSEPEYDEHFMPVADAFESTTPTTDTTSADEDEGSDDAEVIPHPRKSI